MPEREHARLDVNTVVGARARLAELGPSHGTLDGSEALIVTLITGAPLLDERDVAAAIARGDVDVDHFLWPLWNPAARVAAGMLAEQITACLAGTTSTAGGNELAEAVAGLRAARQHMLEVGDARGALQAMHSLVEAVDHLLDVARGIGVVKDLPKQHGRRT